MTPEKTHEMNSDAKRFAEEHWRVLLSAPSQNRTDVHTRLCRQIEVTTEEYGPLGPMFEAAVERQADRLKQEYAADPAALRRKLGISLPMTPEEIIEKNYSSTITQLVEDHWRNLLAQNPIAIKISDRPEYIEILDQVNNTSLGVTLADRTTRLALGTAFIEAVNREMTRLTQECKADSLAFMRRLGIHLPEPQGSGDHCMSSPDESYSVCQFFANGSDEYYKRFVGVEEAMAAARFLITTEAAKFGLTRQVQISNGGQRVVFDWKYGEGIVHEFRQRTPEDMEKTERYFKMPIVTQMAEEHWRNLAIVELSHGNNRHDVIVGFHAKLEKVSIDLGEDGIAFKAAVERKCGELLKQYEGTDRDRIALASRLGVLPEQHRAAAERLLASESPRSTYGSGVGGMVVRTAIRATIWESVRALFRAFR
jgi:hypothetical protein